MDEVRHRSQRRSQDILIVFGQHLSFAHFQGGRIGYSDCLWSAFEFCKLSGGGEQPSDCRQVFISVFFGTFFPLHMSTAHLNTDRATEMLFTILELRERELQNVVYHLIQSSLISLILRVALLQQCCTLLISDKSILHHAWWETKKARVSFKTGEKGDE